MDGTVTLEDGAPLPGGRIELMTTDENGKVVNARGFLDHRGYFSLWTFKQGDGAIAGEHQAVLIYDPDPTDDDLTKAVYPPGIPDRYRNYSTSGLRFTIKPEPNHLEVRLEREPGQAN